MCAQDRGENAPGDYSHNSYQLRVPADDQHSCSALVANDHTCVGHSADIPGPQTLDRQQLQLGGQRADHHHFVLKRAVRDAPSKRQPMNCPIKS